MEFLPLQDASLLEETGFPGPWGAPLPEEMEFRPEASVGRPEEYGIPRAAERPSRRSLDDSSP